MVLVGVDQGAALAELRLPRRAEVYLLTETGTAPEAYQWSVPLGAAVVVVPGNARWLSGAIADLSRRPSGSGQTICVAGGSGGVGTSTLAAGLAFAAARSGRRTALVDLDPGGGGLDLLVGAERLDGWRWPRLVAARGHLGDVGDQLPSVDGVELLSMGRGVEAVRPPAEAVRAVLGSLTATHDLTVVDVPRPLENARVEPLSTAGAWLLVVRDDLRGVTGGREGVRALEAVGVRPRLVVRTGRTRLLDPQTVAEGVGMDRYAVLGDEPGCYRPPSGATHREGLDAVRWARWPDGCSKRSGTAWTPPGPTCRNDPTGSRRPRAAPGIGWPDSVGAYTG